MAHFATSKGVMTPIGRLMRIRSEVGCDALFIGAMQGAALFLGRLTFKFFLQRVSFLCEVDSCPTSSTQLIRTTLCVINQKSVGWHSRRDVFPRPISLVNAQVELPGPDQVAKYNDMHCPLGGCFRTGSREKDIAFSV
jgi:hypothetical protein